MIFKKKPKIKPHITAIIVAAGSGARMGADIPKQFIEVGGRPILAYTLDKFQSSDRIDEIVIVTRSDSILLCKSIVDMYGFTKVSVITEGGATRQQSVKSGLSQMSQDAGYVLVHDGARPMINPDTIEKCVDAVIEHKASAVGVPMKDTVKYSDNGKFITKTVDRSRLWLIQTPQAFEKKLISDCHDKALSEGFEATDDCMLAEHFDISVALVEGEYENIKVTSPSDIFIMEGLLGL